MNETPQCILYSVCTSFSCTTAYFLLPVHTLTLMNSYNWYIGAIGCTKPIFDRYVDHKYRYIIYYYFKV